MIHEFTRSYNDYADEFSALFSDNHPESYKEIIRTVIEFLNRHSDPDRLEPGLDSERIHEIDDGDYQGTLVFVIPAQGYQPSTYWYTTVSYGSCSGCDTLKDIRHYSDNPPTPEQAKDYATLARHCLQNLKKMETMSIKGDTKPRILSHVEMLQDIVDISWRCGQDSFDLDVMRKLQQAYDLGFTEGLEAEKGIFNVGVQTPGYLGG